MDPPGAAGANKLGSSGPASGREAGSKEQLHVKRGGGAGREAPQPVLLRAHPLGPAPPRPALAFSLATVLPSTPRPASPPQAFGARTQSFLGIPRAALYRVALYLQLLWFTSELLLGSAVLTFLPLLQGA